MSIGKRAGKGFISLLYRGILEKLMGVLAMLILARKLTPYDFGLVSITEVLLVLISMIGTTGLTEFLLAYRKDDIDDIFKASFWFNLVISIGILLIFWVALPVWSYYQGDSRITYIGFISGLIFIASQLQVIPKAWLSRNLMFDALVKIQAPFIILISLTKVLAVFLGLGVYSLIVPTLVFQPLLTLLLYRQTKIKPGVKFYTGRWKEIYGFTKHLIGTTVLARIADQGDKIILARFLGLEKLGIYNIATQMADLLITQLVMFSNNILASVLPKYVDDKEKFYKHYMGFLKTFAFFVVPVLAVMLLGAKPIILFLYGSKWEASVVPMQILLVYSAFRAVTSSYGSVMNSFHLNKKSFLMLLVYTPVHIIGSIIGSFYGVIGIALSVLIVKSVFINWNIQQVMNAVSKPFLNWYRDIAPSFISSLFIGLIILFVIKTQALVNVPDLLLISLIGISFITLYCLFFKVVFGRELKRISGFMALTFPRAQRYFNTVFSI